MHLDIFNQYFNNSQNCRKSLCLVFFIVCLLLLPLSGEIKFIPGGSEKTSQIFYLRKDTSSKPRKNCFGNWIGLLEHCLHYTYLPQKWCNSACHWEILDWRRHTSKISLSKVTFHRSGCTTQDPVSRKSWRWALEFLGIKKLISFSLIRNKQKLTRTVTLICWRRPCCLNVIDFIRAMTLNSCKTVFRHTTQKWRNSFYGRTPKTS